ncbi:MAG: hypothetical protein L6R40_007934 [Gallowayella cf. fulva]|nr:MAG: hypothetical protein L6R40_007934 [Xanthomendoza cf. fulva]
MASIATGIVIESSPSGCINLPAFMTLVVAVSKSQPRGTGSALLRQVTRLLRHSFGHYCEPIRVRLSNSPHNLLLEHCQPDDFFMLAFQQAEGQWWRACGNSFR